MSNTSLVLPSATICSLMVLSVGMPRAGSTWQHAMVGAALRQLQVPIDPTKGYWDYPQHVTRYDRTLAATWYAEEYRLWSNLRPRSVVSYKSHEWAPEATRLCRRTVAVSVHRCLDHEAQSILGAGWVRRRQHSNHSAAPTSAERPCWVARV